MAKNQTEPDFGNTSWTYTESSFTYVIQAYYADMTIHTTWLDSHLESLKGTLKFEGPVNVDMVVQSLLHISSTFPRWG